MENYKPNSHRARAAATEKHVEKAVTGTVKTKKKSGARKLADVFIQEDISSVKSYVLTDFVIPGIKRLIFDALTNGLDMCLNGETGHMKTRPGASTVSYRQFYDGSRTAAQRNMRAARAGYDFDDVILDNRGEAEEVLARMDELVDVYGLASVADLYDLVGLKGNYTDNKYGWTDIRSASIMRTRDGYVIKLPRAIPLN